ncbi:hypothetical protein CGRA01v4_03882 [Colletotrichum graminicola]|nr:hypothetical protein CGRA01v4_03882 [Colletotrichum graminicola]
MSFAALNLKLYYAGMNFVLLERRTNIIEDFGASLVLSPPSLRILYHFGIFDKVAEMSAELFDNKKGLHNGRTCVQVYQVVVRRLTSTVRFPSSSHPGGLAWLPGMCVTCPLTRPATCVATARAFASSTGRISSRQRTKTTAKARYHTGKKIAFIGSTDTEAVVTCEDGTSYPGTVVPDADAVYSTTRRQMLPGAVSCKTSPAFRALHDFL